MDELRSTDIEDGLTLDARILLSRATALFVIAVAVTIIAEWAKPRLLSSSHVPVQYLGAIVAGVAVGGVGFAILGLLVATAAAASLGVHQLRARGVSRNAIRNCIVAGMALLVAGFLVFLPFCLGSLPEGTYDCVPLATRLVNWLR